MFCLNKSQYCMGLGFLFGYRSFRLCLGRGRQVFIARNLGTDLVLVRRITGKISLV